MFRKCFPFIVAIALCLLSACSSEPVEYGDALAKLDADAQQAAERMEEAETKVAQKLDEAKAKPNDRSAQDNTALALKEMVGVYGNQISQLDNDLSVLEASGNAMIQRIAQRNGRIKDTAFKAAEDKRLQNAQAKLQLDVATVRARIKEARAAMVQAKDLVLIAQNSEDLNKLANTSRSILELSAKSETLIASIRELTNRDHDPLAVAD